MSELNNQPEFDDALLSAYVDGELTADERAEVEARLATDPQARQLVAELEGVSAKVRSLPRAKVTEDVRAAVLRQLDGPSVPHQPSNLTMRKRLLWPLLATAALLTLMFYQPTGRENEVEVAQADKVHKQKEKEGAEAKNESAPQAASELRAMEEIPEADASGSPRLRDGGSFEELAAAPSGERSELEREMAADSAVALGVGRAAGSMVSPESNVGLVHVTLTDLPSGAEHFDRLLVSNGIQLVSEPADSLAVASKGTASFKDSRLFSETQGRGGAAKPNATESPATEMVLVEGPSEQIENFLLACSQDTEAIESLRIDEPAPVVSGAQPTEQLQQYRQFEKSAPQQSASQNYVVTPEQQGMITALNSLDLDSVGPDSADLQETRAWATKLRPDQSPIELKQLEEQIQSRRNQTPSAKQRNLAKRKADQPQQVRMLFLLHPSESSEK